MPIGTNKLMQMGGGGGDSTPYISASGGSLSTGSHSDAQIICHSLYIHGSLVVQVHLV